MNFKNPHISRPVILNLKQIIQIITNPKRKKNKRDKIKKPKTTSESSDSENANHNRKKNSRNTKKDEPKGEKTSDKQICRFFERGLCRFGISGTKDGKCKFNHPRMCKRIINHGPKSPYGCKGDCDKWHPKLCYSSINKKECLKEHCTFWHIKGTSRSKNDEENTEPKREKPEETIPASFLGPIQGQMTQMFSQQQELIQKEMLQMAQFMNQMHRQIQVLAARNPIPTLPTQMAPQPSVLQPQIRNPTQQHPVVLNPQA